MSEHYFLFFEIIKWTPSGFTNHLECMLHNNADINLPKALNEMVK
jgi:hypothetical protein